MIIRLDDLSGPEIAAFLEEHLRDMRAASPPESKHALDLAALRMPDISFWTAWDDARLIGCCALKQLDPTHAEIKSMRVAITKRRKGIGSALIKHVINEATQRRYRRLSLETGSMAFFDPARKLYRDFGFTDCGPFGSYRQDPNSVFMTLEIGP